MDTKKYGYKLPICDITPFTFQDYPEHTACILWFSGCNFRCAYCHNPEIVFAKKPTLPLEEVWNFLNSRKNLLDGVVLSGGECSLSPAIESFVKDIKDCGFKVKIDTNGSNPALLKTLIGKNLIDFVALDYKAPPHKFVEITKFNHQELFFESLDYLCHSKIKFEVRTTVHTGLINEQDISLIIKDLENRGFTGTFYIQNFNEGPTLSTIDKPNKTLDINALPLPKNFIMKTRNFANS